MKKIILIISLIIIAGCASTSPKKEVASVEHGEYPKDFPEIVKSHYRTITEDPGSIRFNAIHIPRPFSISDAVIQAKHGYLVCADLNLKASDGEYTGHHTDGLLINNGRVIHFLKKGQWLGESIC